MFANDHWLLIVVEWLGSREIRMEKTVSSFCKDLSERSQAFIWHQMSWGQLWKSWDGCLWLLGCWQARRSCTQEGGGVAIAGEKDCTNIWRVHCICPRWATLARNAFLSRIIHWFLHLHLGFPLLQSLVRRPPASYHSQRCSRATSPSYCETVGTSRNGSNN